MFRPINLSVNHKRLRDYSRSRLVEGSRSVVFSWGAVNSRPNAFQSACRVQLSSKLLAWDSGWTETFAQSMLCGSPLPEGIPITLTVTLRDDAGVESTPCSAVFCNADVSWKAEWIGLPCENRKTIYLRREFSIDKPLDSAVLYACGIGYQKLSLNGRALDVAALDPAHTDYTKTCQYVTYPEFEKQLVPGKNCLGAIIGTGWRFNAFAEGVIGRAPLFTGPVQFTAMLRLNYDDGTTEWLMTDEQWQAGFGAHTASDLFNGEAYDANLTASGWDLPGFTGFKPAQIMAAPGGKMRPMILNPVIEYGTRKPVAFWPVKDGAWVMDFGRNIAGVLRVCLPALQKGQVIALTHAEELQEDGTLYTAPLRSAKACDTYTASGDERDLAVWQPIFTYHGFRYARVDGLDDFDPDCFEAVELHTDMESKSFFRCGDPIITAIHEACAATERANQHSILTDCPQRDERQGWMNDATVRFEETPYNFEIGGIFPKLIRDLMDIQNDEGAITCTAPYVFGGQPADPVCSSFLLAGLESWLHEGNLEIIREAFDAFAGWESCLLAHSTDSIVDYSYYGDWAGPAYACEEPDGARSVVTPGEFMSTGYSYFNCCLLERFAGLLNRTADQKHWHHQAETVKTAMLKKWYNPQTAVMATGSQACQAFSLWLGLIPEADRAKAAAHIHKELAENDYRFTTGNLCTRYLMDVLCDYGYLEDAWRIVSSKSYPSWGFMLEQEATTIWERFELKKNPGMNSHNHPMYAAVDYWFYAYLCGIRPMEQGYRRVLIKPFFPKELMSAQAVVDTVRGELAVRWMKRYGGTHLHVNVPFGTTAVVEFMGNTYEVGSGFHTFKAEDPE